MSPQNQINYTNLPDDLGISLNGNIQVFGYKNLQNIHKSKINLSKHTISFLRAGSKEVIGQGKAKKIDSSSFLIMKSGKCLMTETISNSNKFYQSTLLFFDNESVLNFLEKYRLKLNTKTQEKSFYVFDYDEFSQQYVNGLDSLLKLPVKTQQQLFNTKFEEIMLYLTNIHGSNFLNSMVQHADDRLSKLTHIVDNNKLNRLTLEELAFLCNMSTSTFKREFFKLYHRSPMKWFLEQRLNHTAILLRTHQKRPIDLYEQAGYENFSNFVQAFKKKFGLTPKQYQSQS
ncbi:MAG: AraC family transcriptional regulator [Bacteroidia bacterium]|nr:AraC family transcriptional regulator [Bacteroidia bacterium]